MRLWQSRFEQDLHRYWLLLHGFGIGLLGAVLDALVPEARSLPHAVRLLKAR